MSHFCQIKRTEDGRQALVKIPDQVFIKFELMAANYPMRKHSQIELRTEITDLISHILSNFRRHLKSKTGARNGSMSPNISVSSLILI